MTSKYIILAIFCCLGNSHGCNFSPEYNTTICSSINNAIREGSSEWGNLKCQNFGNQSLSVLRKDSFTRSPNLNSLTIQGLANGIANDAFNGLYKLQKLELFDNNIILLPYLVFGDLPIENLYIVNNSLESLEKDIFSSMPKLRVLYIRKNNMATIRSDVFSDLNIEELYLEDNKIQTIENFAFVNMRNLRKLSLSDNLLQKFDTKIILGSGSSKLNKLWLNKNQLTTITREMFSLLPKLKYLYLEMNKLTAIQDFGFRDLKKLVVLDISNNNLELIQANVLPAEGMESLELFFLHNNRLTFFNTTILERMPRVKYFTIFGNPWQCPCYNFIKTWIALRNVTQVCDYDYADGKRPVCIFATENKNTCVYDENINKDLYNIYSEANAEYPVVQPKCNVGEGYPGIYGLEPEINT